MEIGKMEDFTIDQFAGSMALILGSIGGLLMIIWKSRCACKVNCCGLFRCERSPPPDEGASDGEEDKKVQSKPTIQPQQVEEVVVERDSLIP
jgi:hypothetical protein|tara:strand:+ start:54 stop:329 length:276 start_codon:yes stop_codon:yes gene_type:complete